MPCRRIVGVKANVLFFDRKPGAPGPWTKTVWVYDLRTNRQEIADDLRSALARIEDVPGDLEPRMKS